MTALGDFTAGQVLTAADLNAIGEWTDFTPVFTGITVGNGTAEGRYCQIGKFVAWQVALTVGSSTVMAASYIDYPLTAANFYLAGNGGQVTFEDANGVDYQGSLFRSSSVRCTIYAMYRSTNDYIAYSSIANNVPFTWATGDRLIIQDFYEAA